MLTLPRTGLTHPVRRAVLAALLAAFTATGQGGLSALEVVTHLVSPEQAEHARTPHYEAPDSGTHSDHCQLGLHHHDNRLFTGPSTRSSAPVATAQSAPSGAVRAVSFRPTRARLPRAPPHPALSIR